MKNALKITALAMLLASCSSKPAEEVSAPKMASVTQFDLDQMNVSWIRENDGAHLMPARMFVGADSALIDSLGVADGVPSAMSAYLVRLNGKNILFDTGNGGERGKVAARLDTLGVPPTAIDYLFITHFHGDHIGGMLNGDNVVYPNAQVYVNQAEYDAWMSDTANVQAITTMQKYQSQLHLFNIGDALPEGVQGIEAYGHTPGHTVYQCGKLLVVGDLMHGAALQLFNPEICASFDADKPKCIESRKRILKYADDNGLVVAGMHMPMIIRMPAEK